MAPRDGLRASSVWPEMPFMRGPQAAERLHELLPVLRDNRRRALQRRDRVLAHDWARRRLCIILQTTDAKKWNGFLPLAENNLGDLRKSEIRHSLIELLRDVAAADKAAEVLEE